jgi:hypothetical protein
VLELLSGRLTVAIEADYEFEPIPPASL